MDWRMGGVETNKCHVKYEANVSELACDELKVKSNLLSKAW